jgi:hypothetical protein
MSNSNIYIGADLHKNTCYVTVMNRPGKIKKQTEIGTDTDSVKSFFKKYASIKVAVESTVNRIPFYENLESLGCDVSLSNPLRTKAIAAARIKLEFRKVYQDGLNRYLQTLDLLNQQVDELSLVIKEKAKLDYDCKLQLTPLLRALGTLIE